MAEIMLHPGGRPGNPGVGHGHTADDQSREHCLHRLFLPAQQTLGVDRPCAQMTFRATKDIRDKYVLSRLAWDLGILEDLCALL